MTEEKLNPFQVDNAKKAWQILLDKAKEQKTMTYSDIAEVMDCNARNTPLFLKIIRRSCDKYKMPPLYALVVLKGSGLPGFVKTAEEHAQMLKNIFENVDNLPSSLKL